MKFSYLFSQGQSIMPVKAIIDDLGKYDSDTQVFFFIKENGLLINVFVFKMPLVTLMFIYW